MNVTSRYLPRKPIIHHSNKLDQKNSVFWRSRQLERYKMQILRIMVILMFAAVVIGEARKKEIIAEDVYVETRGCFSRGISCDSDGVS